MGDIKAAEPIELKPNEAGLGLQHASIEYTVPGVLGVVHEGPAPSGLLGGVSMLGGVIIPRFCSSD